MAEAPVRERHEFPMVVTKMYQRDLEAMRLIGTSGLRQSDKRFFNCSVTNHSERERECNICHEVKPLDEFVRNRSDTSVGRRYECRPCWAKRCREYRSEVRMRAAA